MVMFHPNSEEDSWGESVNLSVRSVSGLCGISNIGTTNELNDDRWRCYRLFCRGSNKVKYGY